VPEVSRFFGIRIFLYYRDHAPPHFHAEYQGVEAKILIADGEPLEGHPPARQMALVRRWARESRNGFLENWGRARREEPLLAIAPLE
jgi:hypothetical protein